MSEGLQKPEGHAVRHETATAQDAPDDPNPKASSKNGIHKCRGYSDESVVRGATSFGDQGTTATTGADGQLVHFSQSLNGLGISGMFSLDHWSVPQPDKVLWRLENLESRAFSASHPDPFFHKFGCSRRYGLRFPELEKEEALPRFEWDQCRWPRYEYEAGSFDCAKKLRLTIQWFVHENVLIQKCILENCGNEVMEAGIEASFFPRMSIRELDHADSKNNSAKLEAKKRMTFFSTRPRRLVLELVQAALAGCAPAR